MLTFIIIWLLCSVWSICIALKLELEQVECVTLGFMTVVVVASLLTGPAAAIITSIVYLIVSGRADRFFSRIVIDRRNKDV